MLMIEFFANQVSCYIENDVCVVALAEGLDANPDCYLIFTENLFDEVSDVNNTFDLEFSGFTFDKIEKIKSIKLELNQVTINGLNDGKKQFDLKIKFDSVKYEELKLHFPFIFKKTTEIELII
jgi:hypothetical protein